MQLKKLPIRSALTLATCTLLGTGQSQADDDSDWNMDISSLYYAENERVTVNKLQSILSRDNGEGEKLDFSLVYDTMSGASPNGRLYTGDSNTNSVSVTTASGFAFDVSGGTSAQSGSQPWLTEFKDTRVALNVDWSKPVMRNFTTHWGLSASVENDYNSFGGNMSANIDMFQKRTTLTLGAGMNLDSVDPNGGIPEGLGRLECADSTPNIPNWIDCDAPVTRYEAGEKIVNDYLIGLTQVWNRYTLMQFNYAYGNITGYLTDPYKQVSVIDNTFDGEIAILYEKRPDVRQRQSVFWKMVRHRIRDVYRLSYRYFWDNWAVRAHTVDFRYRWELSPKHYLQPHLRYSRQTAAGFFGTHLSSDDELPDYFSADNRLGEQNTYTAGLKYGVKLGSNGEIGLRVEMLQQHYLNNPLPDMEVLVVQGSVSLNF